MTAGANRAAGTFQQRRTPEIYLEPAEIESLYAQGTGVSAGAGLGYQVRPRIALGLTVGYARSSAGLDVTARVPHPTRFNEYRDATTRVQAERSTLDVDLTGSWLLRPHRKALLALGAGLSVSRVTQQRDTGQMLTDVFPFQTVTLRAIALERAKATGAGGHAAAEMSWLFTRRLGLAGDLRWRVVSPSVSEGGRRTEIPAGGLSARVGLHMRF